MLFSRRNAAFCPQTEICIGIIKRGGSHFAVILLAVRHNKPFKRENGFQISPTGEILHLKK